MVRSGQLLLIDVAFAQVRPSPWRQAVDLGNMMLVLAIRSSPQHVYRRALAYFTPDELAEAFAATRGVASPTQLRAFMKRDPRDLLGEFRALAPQRPPIALQRWSIQQIALAVAVFAVIAAVAETGNAILPAAENLGASPPVAPSRTTISAPRVDRMTDSRESITGDSTLPRCDAPHPISVVGRRARRSPAPAGAD